ncbi:MAG: hypothetical protein Q4D56_00615 [Bacteroides sp.]|nr:hypothetical protein [Bacteroides sp.]
MKKLILSIALCCAATNFFAQEADPAALVNEGKTALEAKNYQEAYNKFSTYLSQTNFQDSVIAYNCGVCADKIKKPAEAAKYFDIAVQKKYNLANAYIGKAGALKDLKKNDEYLATLKEGLEAVPGNKTLTKLYANYYVNAGITAQKAGKTEEAEDAFKQVLTIQDNNLNALYSLGTLYYNNGATTLKNATPLATSDRAKYDAEAAKADQDFKDAKVYLEKLVPLLSADKPAQKKMLDNANNLLKQVNEQLK